MSVASIALMCPFPIIILNTNHELLLVKYRGKNGRDIVLCRKELMLDVDRPDVSHTFHSEFENIICQTFDMPSTGPLYDAEQNIALSTANELRAYQIAESILARYAPQLHVQHYGEK